MSSLAFPANRSAGASGASSRAVLGGWPCALLVALLGAVIRLHGLSDQSFWGDEIAAVELAKAPLHLLWSDWMVRETNPPLYYSVLHVWMGVFGQSEGAVRSLSALFGSGAILLVYALGRRMADGRTALIASLLSALWVHQIYYSQEARGYILGTCGALVAVIALCRISDDVVGDRKVSRGDAALNGGLYVGGCLVALYTHTTHVLVPALANLYFAWLWAFRSPRRVTQLAGWLGLNLLVASLWLWWGIITWKQLHLPHTNVSWIGKATLPHGLGTLITAYGAAPESDSTALPFKILRFAGTPILLGCAIFGALRLTRERAVMLGVFGFGAPLLLFVLSQHTPVMLPRTFLWAQFAPILGLASAIAAVRSETARLAVIALLSAMLLIGVAYQPPREPWREVASEINGAAQPGDVMLVSSISAGAYLQHYCRALHCTAPVVDVAQPQDAENRWAQGIFTGPVLAPHQVAALARRGHTIYAVSHWEDDPTDVLRTVAQPTAMDVKTPLPRSMTLTAWKAAGPS